jgi:hypothetical protein
MPRIYIPYLNPLNLVEVDPAEVPQYESMHIDDYWWKERLNKWQQGTEQYYQPWRSDDVVVLQLQNNAGQLQVQVVNCNLEIQLTFLMQQKQQNTYQPEYFIYESSTALTPLPDGRYFFIVRAGTNPVKKTSISEPILIQAEQPRTLLIEYVNRSYYGNMIFETGITPSIRIQGFLTLQPPPSKDTLYEDQVLDMIMVQSKPYRLLELTIEPVPDWMIDKLNWIFGCSGLRIDGKYFTKNEGAKWEETVSVMNGALKGYKIQLRESISRNSKVFDTTDDTDEELNLLVNADSKGFADTTEAASSSVVQFYDVL